MLVLSRQQKMRRKPWRAGGIFSPDAKDLTPQQRREGIEALQYAIAGLKLPSALKGGEGECQHIFHDGLYARGLLIPAGELVIGRLHRQDRICIIASGSCIFVDENQRKEVSAPWFGAFKKGSKTAVYALSDVYWIAILRTELTDSRTAFESLTCASHEEYQAGLNLSFTENSEEIP